MCDAVDHAIADLPSLLTMLPDSPSVTGSSEAASAHGVSYPRLPRVVTLKSVRCLTV